MSDAIYYAVFVISGLFFLLTLANSRLATYLLLVLSVSLEGIVTYFEMPTQLLLLKYGTILSYFLVSHLRKYTHDRLPRQIKSLVLLFLGVTIASGIVNGSNLSIIARSFVDDVLFLFLLSAVNRFSFGEVFSRRVVRLVVCLVILQVPVVWLHFFFNPALHPDNYGGTLGTGGTDDLAILIALLACFIASSSFIEKQKKWLWATAPILFSVILISSTPAAFVFSFLGIAGVILLQKRRGWAQIFRPRYIAIICFLVVLIIVSVSTIYPILPSEYQGEDIAFFMFTREGFLQYMAPDVNPNRTFGQQEGRIGKLMLVSAFLLHDPVRLFLGYGPAAMMYESKFLGTTGALANSELEVLLGGGYGLDVMLIQTGSLSVMLYILAIVYVFRFSLSLLRQEKDKWWLWLLTAYSSFIPIFVLAHQYNNAWKSPATAIPFWLVFGLILLRGRRTSIALRTLHR